MTESTRVVARPPIGGENNQPAWSRHSLETTVFQALEAERRKSWLDKPIGWPAVLGLLALVIATITTVAVTATPTEREPLTGDLND